MQSKHSFIRLFATAFLLGLDVCAPGASSLHAASISTTSLPDGRHGTAYWFALQGTGSVPQVWMVASGDLPEGLTLSPGGLLSGIPTEPGDFSVTLGLQDGSGGSDSHVYSLRVDTVAIPPVPRPDWRLIPLSVSNPAGGPAFEDALASGTDASGIVLPADGTWTATVELPATVAGGMLTFSGRLGAAKSTAGYTAMAEVSVDSTNGTDGAWTSLPLNLYRVSGGEARRTYNKMQKAEFDSSAQWLRLTVNTPATDSLTLNDLGLYQFDPAGRDDYWLSVGASILERGMNNTTFKQYFQSEHQMDPVLFNVAVGGFTTDSWVDGAPNNLLAQVLANHPRARYVLIHIGGNNISESRPYMDYQSDAEDANLHSDLVAIVKQVIAAGRYPILSLASFRDYQTSPAVDGGLNEENGSGPYNHHSYNPIAARYLPDLIDPDTGRNRVDPYTFLFENQQFIDDDGVHMVTSWSEYPSPQEAVWSAEIFGIMAGPILYREPTFLRQPQNVWATKGENVRFEVRAEGLNLSYSWLKDAKSIVGETAEDLSINLVDALDYGDYRASVQVDGGPSFRSFAAHLSDFVFQEFEDYMLLDLGGVATSGTARTWNSLAGSAASLASGSVRAPDDSVRNGVSVQVSTFTDGLYDETAGFSGNPELPDDVAADGFYVKGTGTNGPSLITIQIDGLDRADSFNLRFFGTRQFTTPSRITRYTVGGGTTEVAYLDVAANTDQFTQIAGIQPDAGGSLTIDVEARDVSGASTYYGYLSSIEIERYAAANSFSNWVGTALPSADYTEIERSEEGDADADGITNLTEFFSGTDPKVSNGFGQVYLSENGAAGLRFEYDRTINSTTVPVYQSSTDLNRWMNIGLVETVVDPDVDGDGLRERIRVEFSMTNDSNRFLRLKVVDPAP